MPHRRLRCPPSLLTVAHWTIRSQSSEATADGPWPATGQQSLRTNRNPSPRPAPPTPPRCARPPVCGFAANRPPEPPTTRSIVLIRCQQRVAPDKYCSAAQHHPNPGSTKAPSRWQGRGWGREARAGCDSHCLSERADWTEWVMRERRRHSQERCCVWGWVDGWSFPRHTKVLRLARNRVYSVT
jgi:hypothetical protein